MIHRKRIFFTGLLSLLGHSSGFVIRPCIVQRNTRVVTQLDLSAPLLDGTTSPLFHGDNSPKHPSNALAKLGNAVLALFRRHTKDAEDDEIIVSPQKLPRQDLDILRPLPWPIRAITNTIARNVHRELAHEQHKAKPLLKEAQHCIKQDKDLKALLGEPIHIRPIFSGSTSTSIINGKKTSRILDKFEVVGSKKTGVATLKADKYAKGHLQDLRVDVGGIHYDVDV